MYNFRACIQKYPPPDQTQWRTFWVLHATDQWMASV